jgi:hypothetical protein
MSPNVGLLTNSRNEGMGNAREMGMDDRELIAAILTAGMMPKIPIARRASGRLTEAEGETLRRAVAHAVGLYRSVLEGLGADPFTGLPGHDTPRPVGASSEAYSDAATSPSDT